MISQQLKRPLKKGWTALRDRATDAFDQLATPYVKEITRMSSISDFEAADVIVAGYPKSGNTWTQFMLSGVIYGFDPLLVPDQVVQQLIPDIHYQRYYKRTHSPMFFKSHHWPRPEYRRVVHLLRDGRDVMVSFYHAKKALGQAYTMAELVQGKGIIGLWHEHTEAWLENPYHAEMMTVRYEDLKQDAVTEMQRICDFAGITRPAESIERVVKHASFDKMHRREAEEGKLLSYPLWPEGVHAVRRGKVGSYRDEMPAEILELFLRQAKPTLQKCGYEV